MTQNFKGDDFELQIRAAAEPVINQIGHDLDAFLSDGFNSVPLILMLYDDGRMPFSNRIPRTAFVDFIAKAFENFHVTGTFEAYLFILRQIFGSLSEITFDVPAPGKLAVSVNATSSLEFDCIGREFVSGAYDFFGMETSDGDQLVFRGIAGIQTEAELNLLFSEIIPLGISPTIALTFFSRYDFITDDIDDVITDAGDQIVFTEIGG